MLENRWVATGLAGLLLLLLCLGTVQKAIAGVHECELMYEIVPHDSTAGLVGKDIYRKLQTFDQEQWDKHSRRQSQQLQAVININPNVSRALALHEVRITQGGYEGVSNVSIKARLGVADTETNKELAAFASMLGYIYYQDSVLVICKTALNKDTRPAFVHSLSDAGAMDYINPLSARLIFGMMMGYLNKVKWVGYTYDKTSDFYEVLEFDLDSQKKKKALQFIAANLAEISAGKVKLNIKTTKVYAFFPQNTWSQYRAGEKYQARFSANTSLDGLQAVRKAYLDSLAAE